jgi:hypothetical protein
MNEPTPPPARTAPRIHWSLILLAGLVLLIGGTSLTVRYIVDTPARTITAARGGFQQDTVRTEILSHATELTGTSRFQFATLKQTELFKREETGTTAWGWVSLPKVVVQAQIPVEYTYSVDFAAPWQVERHGTTVRVFAPPIEPNPPAADISALTFYTLEGSIWRDEAAVRDRLQKTLSAALAERARTNEPLIREIARARCAEFFEKWLASRFDDGAQLQVKVIFPDERPAPALDTASQ